MSDIQNLRNPVAADELAGILRALAQSPLRRVACIETAGRRVWVKRYDTEPPPVAKRLHNMVSPLIYPVIFRGSRPLHGAAAALRERTRMEAFQAAGFGTPDIVHHAGPLLILSDLSDDLFSQMRGAAGPPDQTTLDRAFTALARAHGAGLVHGRPHLRDMADRNGEICFLDFEEAPEEVMPVADAQARDLWLLLLPVVALDADDRVLARCLASWLGKAPQPAVRSLARFARFCRRINLLTAAIPARWQGGDLRRFLAAARFLAGSISDMDSAIAASGAGGGSGRVNS